MMYSIAVIAILSSFLLYALTGSELWASVFMCVLAIVVTCATLL